MRNPSSDRLLAALVAAWVFALYWPALALPLLSDDYYWWQLGRAAGRHPSLLLAPLGQFWRPLATVQWALEARVWDHWTQGYHLDALLLHAACAVLLFVLARRLGLSRAAGAAVALLWAGAPFAEEPAISPASRHDLHLLLAWLALALAWPGRGGRWTPARGVGVAAASAVALLGKESWVATPLLAAGLARARGGGWRSSLWMSTPWVGAVGVYAVVHAAALPTGGYFGSPRVAGAKALHQLAAFLWLEQLVPVGFRAGFRGMLALVAVGAAAAWGVRRGRASATVGTALLLAGMLPTLPVPYLPTRYTTIPYAGFLLLAADTVVALVATVPERWRRAAGVATGSIVVLVAVAGALVVRADLVDWARVADAQRRLLAEAAAVAPELSEDEPVLVVRADRWQPLGGVALSPRGWPKIFYVRHEAPYGLVEAAPLFEWVLAPTGRSFRPVPVRNVDGRAGSVLVHRDGGFSPPRRVEDLARAAAAWKKTGLPFQIIEAEPFTRRP